MTRLGRTLLPSVRLNFMPRTRPVMPATRTTTPEAGLPLMVGSTISLLVQVMRVRSPLWSCPAHLLAMPSRHFIGNTVSGKSSSSRSLTSSSVLMLSSISRAAVSVAPMRHTNSRWP